MKSPQTLRRWLFIIACIITLIALFYAEEDWRGKRAWEKCRTELESQGARLDWAAHIPAPVPDDQNIFKAPKMTEWFAGKWSQTNELSQWLSTPSFYQFVRNSELDRGGRRDRTNPPPKLLLEVTVVPMAFSVPAGESARVLQLDDPTAPDKAQELLREVLGPAINGSQGYFFVARKPEQIKPARLFVASDQSASLAALRPLFPTNMVASETYSAANLLRIDAAGGSMFRVSLNVPAYLAADYVAWSDRFEEDFDLIRDALKRPLAQMEGDYQHPVARPIPQYIFLRVLAQTLAQRAQCHLLLDRPEQALRDVTLLHGLSRLLEDHPNTLVATMIDVAISGIYVDTLGSGLRLQVWRDPQLAAIQKQLSEMNFPPFLAKCFESDRAAVCHVLAAQPADLAIWLSGGGAKLTLWQELKHPIFWLLRVAPRGWVYQNLVTIAENEQAALDNLDLKHDLILARKADDYVRQAYGTFSHSSPYTFMAAVAVPNFSKATQTLALNQTRANEAQIVCALERFHRAHSQYPETLDELTPQFIEKLPHDIISGQPLKYHRNDGQFLLYSVGWNQTDEGGVRGKTIREGDWVWR